MIFYSITVTSKRRNNIDFILLLGFQNHHKPQQFEKESAKNKKRKSTLTG